MKIFFGKFNKGPARIAKRGGFTLIETLVAVSIFSLSIVISMKVLSNGLTSTIFAKQKVIATYLAQEGIEYVRNLRDTYMLFDTGGAQNGWINFKNKLTLTTNCQTATNGCYLGDIADTDFDYSANYSITNLTVSACTDSVCSNAPLYYHGNTGKYDNNPTLGVNSGFYRIIKIDATNFGSDEVKITSTVRSTQKGAVFNTSFTENLYNWIR